MSRGGLNATTPTSNLSPTNKFHEDWFEFIHSPPDVKMHPNVDGLPRHHNSTTSTTTAAAAASRGVPSPSSLNRYPPRDSSRISRTPSSLQTSTYDLESLEQVVANRGRRGHPNKEEGFIPPPTAGSYAIAPSYSFRSGDGPMYANPVASNPPSPIPPPSTNLAGDLSMDAYEADRVVVVRPLDLGGSIPVVTPRRPPPPIPQSEGEVDEESPLREHSRTTSYTTTTTTKRQHGSFLHATPSAGNISLSSSFDSVERSPFMINLWLGTHSLSSSSPTQVLVHHRFRYFTQLCEKAATQLRCRPAPEYLYTPEGRVIRQFCELRPGQHYIILPAGCAYRESSVPLSLLQLLIGE